MAEMGDKIMVCIHCMTYNHEKYLADALEGFVMQKTNFPFVAVVIDDCSTDRTAMVLKEYENRYPEIIKPVYLKENYFSQHKSKIKFLEPWDSRAKFIAICEGDDYWTDPYKLQKQVDFLEKHSEYSVCFHRYKIFDQEEGVWRNDGCGVYLSENKEGTDIDIEMFLRHWVTQPLTIMYRSNISTCRPEYKHYRDIHLIFHLLQDGKGRILNFIGGVYREHLGGIDSKKPLCIQQSNAIEVAEELYQVNGTKELRDNLIRIYDWVIASKSLSKITTAYLIIKRFNLSLSYKKAFKHILSLIRK